MLGEAAWVGGQGKVGEQGGVARRGGTGYARVGGLVEVMTEVQVESVDWAMCPTG